MSSVLPPPTPPPGRARPRSMLAGLDDAPVTRAILVFNVAVFVVEAVYAGRDSFSRGLFRLPEREALAFGASYPLATVGEHRWETLLTACFLHDGVFHLAFNMVALVQAGPLLERAIGPARTAALFVLAGVGGNALSVAIAWLERSSRLTVGASGAICGLLAAGVVVGWRARGRGGALVQTMLPWLAFVAVFGLFSKYNGGSVDNAAHAGGALAGAAFALLWRWPPPSSSDARPERGTGWILAASTVLLVGCVAVVGYRDRIDAFAALSLQDRFDFTTSALAARRCDQAEEGLLAVERLRAKMAPVTSLRGKFEAACGGRRPP